MSHGASGVSLFTYTVPYIMGELMLRILSHIPWVSSQVSQGYSRVLYVILVGIYIVAAAIGPHFEHKRAEIGGQPAANPQPTRKQPATIGLHCGDKKTGIHGQPTANPQLVVQILGTKKAGIHGQPATIGQHFGHKKAGIYGQPATIGLHFRDKKVGIHGQPAANPQLLIHILGTREKANPQLLVNKKSIANPQPLANLQQT
jgi:hypothetical protein